MSPEHAEAMAKRGLGPYTPWERASQDFGYPCRDGCGARVGWPNSRCGRCKQALRRALDERKALRAARLAKKAA